MIEADERGFQATGEVLCSVHVEDDYLRSALDDGPGGRCAVCGLPSVDPVLLDPLLEILIAVVRRYRTRAANELLRDPESDNGWALASTIWTEDLVWDFFCPDLNDELCALAARRLVNDEWFDPGTLWFQGRELLSYSWQRFRAEIPDDPFVPLPSGSADEWADGIAPDAMLKRVGDLVSSLGLIRPCDPSLAWYRVVAVAPSEALAPRRLGTAPENYAAANRMSSAGTGRFYGATDIPTAISEVGQPPPGNANVLGRWQPSRALRLLDLTALPTTPSVYDVERSNEREALLFLSEFADDVSRPLLVGASETEISRQYRPTQALVDYLTSAFPDLDGVVYRSSRTKGPCCALFVRNENCVGPCSQTLSGGRLLMRLCSARRLP